MAGRMPMREERRFVTALFADIVGSTALAGSMDPEDVREIVGGAIDRIVSVVEELGGTIKDLAGDGALALFGAPVAHEDDAERAVRAGLRISEEIGAYAERVNTTWGIPGFNVRIGIESGVVVLGPVGSGRRVEYGATGDAVNTAARLQAHAHPGTVLVGRETQRLIRDRFVWGRSRSLPVKGKADPVIAYPAIRLADRAGTPGGKALTPLVGRVAELELLRGAVDTVASGEGRLVIVSGEPGIGKSRLLAEARSQVEAIGGRWLEGRCLSFGASSPYLPIADLLRGWLRVQPDTSAEDLMLQISTAVEGSVGDRADGVRPFVAALLGVPPSDADAAVLASLSPDSRRFRTGEALGELLSGMARAAPVAVAIEDLHWADGSSVQLLSRLLPRLRSTRLLIALTSRDGPDRPAHRLLGPGLGTTPILLHLTTLPTGADRELLTALTGGVTLPGELERRILDTSGGNPFYLEELVRSLVEEGAIVTEGDEPRFDHLVEVRIPPTIEKVIGARLDRLGERPREVLAAASVIGRRFTIELLERVAGDGEDIRRAIDELDRLDVVRPVDGPAAAFAFQHALIQEVTYSTLLKRRRRELHAKTAAALQELHGERDDEVLPLLAHHFRAAGQIEQAYASHRGAAAAALRVSA
ncbi:MAG TPA: AAA family ATPase, partial [Actinomycetota bacterium]|nr:AAA family ATPase [Actinomycetota bacterium]